MEELQNFSNGVINLPVRVLANGDIEFDAEQAALGLGISTIATSGNETVRWSRVNKYLGINEEPVIRGDFITEPQFYKLAFKANNETAEKFQDWVSSDVLPSIRKTGSYQTKPLTAMDQIKLLPKAVIELDDRVTDLEENQVIPKGDYDYIASRVNKRVSEISHGYGAITQKQRGCLFKDINGGIKQIAGVNSRSNLRKKDYQMVVDFIADWEPSTATKMIIRQTSLDLN